MSAAKRDVLYGTLGLMILKTLEALGPLHGYRIARRLEQISGTALALNQGTLYPALVRRPVYCPTLQDLPTLNAIVSFGPTATRPPFSREARWRFSEVDKNLFVDVVSMDRRIGNNAFF
jgi:hypothetical protein